MYRFKINKIVGFVSEGRDLHEVMDTTKNLVVCEGDLETCEEFIQWFLAFPE